MRFGELRWLTWDDVDLVAGVLHIRPKENWRPKTGDQRAIPISPAARQVLESLPRTARWVVTALPSATYPRGGHQISERRLLAYLKRILTQLGLRGHLHTFRHTFISNAYFKPNAGSDCAELVRTCGPRNDQDLHARCGRCLARGNQRLADVNAQLKKGGLNGQPNADVN